MNELMIVQKVNPDVGMEMEEVLNPKALENL
jgi:hypothetical protein